MKKLLLINRIGLFVTGVALFSCGTSEETVSSNSDASTENNVELNSDKSKVITDSTVLKDPALGNDSSRAITHGAPDQEKLDSIKNAKTNKKKGQ